MENKEISATAANQSLPSLENEEEDGATEQVAQDGDNQESDERINMELTESDLQLQVRHWNSPSCRTILKLFSPFQITDEEGNPIPLSIQDARQLLSEGQFVSQLGDGQTIRVHSGVLTPELAQRLDVEGGSMVMEDGTGETVDDDGENAAGLTSTTHTDAEEIVKSLEVR